MIVTAQQQNVTELLPLRILEVGLAATGIANRSGFATPQPANFGALGHPMFKASILCLNSVLRGEI